MKDITTEEAIKILEELSTFYDVKLENGDVAIEKVLNELEKKDKIIDAMVEEWFELDTLFMIRGKNIHSKEQLKQYFEEEIKDE